MTEVCPTCQRPLSPPAPRVCFECQKPILRHHKYTWIMLDGDRNLSTVVHRHCDRPTEYL